MSRARWHNRLLTLMITLCLLWQSTIIVLAQTDSEGPILDSTDPLRDDTPVEPYVPKDEITTSDPEEEKKPQQGSYNLYMPHMVSTSSDEETVQVAAPTWRVILTERFEGIFPPTSSYWSLYDYNGPSVGTPPNPAAKVIWDDTSTRAHTGYWSAHPNAYYNYANNTDTWMKYGPLDLAGAKDAVLNSWFYLDTETYFDFFLIEYSCKNKGNWNAVEYSGKSGAWVASSISLANCLGQKNVYIRFTFRSDYSNPATPPGGVWVDDIEVKVLK
jgi:hypothetical protein